MNTPDDDLRKSAAERDQQAQFAQILDRLRVTPQHFLDLTHGIGREAVSTVDEAQPILIRPSKARWPLTYLYRINIDKFDQSLRNAMDALGVGYCYMIKRRGNILHLHASGWAQVGTDGHRGRNAGHPGCTRGRA